MRNDGKDRARGDNDEDWEHLTLPNYHHHNRSDKELVAILHITKKH